MFAGSPAEQNANFEPLLIGSHGNIFSENAAAPKQGSEPGFQESVAPARLVFRDLDGEALGSDQLVAGEEKIADFVPVGFAAVEAERHPPSVSEIVGQVVAARLRGDQRGVFSRQDFAGNADDAVAMMVVEKVGEGLLADEKLSVRAVHRPGGFREGHCEPGDPFEMGVERHEAKSRVVESVSKVKRSE